MHTVGPLLVLLLSTTNSARYVGFLEVTKSSQNSDRVSGRHRPAGSSTSWGLVGTQGKGPQACQGPGGWASQLLGCSE